MSNAIRVTVAVAAAVLAIGEGRAFAQGTGAVGPYYAVPAWDQTLPSSTRFIVLSNFNSEAVLDRETGVVFEKSPSVTAHTWAAALEYCANKTVGAKKGWRLPTVQELSNLYNPAGNPTFPAAMPANHPFALTTSAYWTATEWTVSNDAVYIVNFSIGGNDGAFPQDKAGNFAAWCVRAGGVVNPQ